MVDIDAQANATVALGVDKTTEPSVYDVLRGDVEAAVRGADVVACCTDAREPVIRRAFAMVAVNSASVPRPSS